MKANAHFIAKVHTVSNVRMIAKVTVLLKLLTSTSFEDGDKFHVRDIDIWFHDEFVDHGSHFLSWYMSSLESKNANVLKCMRLYNKKYKTDYMQALQQIYRTYAHREAYETLSRHQLPSVVFQFLTMLFGLHYGFIKVKKIN